MFCGSYCVLVVRSTSTVVYKFKYVMYVLSSECVVHMYHIIIHVM
jgi:hypothetical protein